MTDYIGCDRVARHSEHTQLTAIAKRPHHSVKADRDLIETLHLEVEIVGQGIASKAAHALCHRGEAVAKSGAAALCAGVSADATIRVHPALACLEPIRPMARRAISATFLPHG